MARPQLAKWVANVLSNVMVGAVGVGGAITLANTALFTGDVSGLGTPQPQQTLDFMEFPLHSILKRVFVRDISSIWA
jgi:hypothetical protein